VAGGYDVDNDGHVDYAFAAQRAGVTFGRADAGQIFLVFGNGQISGQQDTLNNPSNILRIIGDQVKENAGSEIWMGDVTGDGVGDLIICRQNYSPGGTRIGAGALTLLPGGSALRDLASNNTTLDLRNPPANLPIVNILGAFGANNSASPSRLCIWARAGDVTGDGIQDLVIGADREASNGEANSGAVYVVRGGAHLAVSQTIDLASFGAVSVGNIARIKPPIGSTGYDLGATVQVADLDNNGKAEVLAAAALNRAGAGLPPNGGTGRGTGGSQDGTVYIAWDNNFTGTWIPAPDFRIGQGPGSFTTIEGSTANGSFGEEMLGGLDYDNDGNADLFVGDLVADGWGAIFNGNNAGTGHVIYNAASLKELSFDLDSPPIGFTMATFVGPVPGAIAGDTAMHGDFNGDGIDDLAFSSPKDNPSPKDAPLGRSSAGTLHIILGQNGVYPALSSLKPSNYPSSGVSIFEIYGAEGSGNGWVGDVLAYSGAEGDVNGDGVSDLIVNEMQGDGSVDNDVGNLLIIDGAVLFGVGNIFGDGFEDSN
ncbi:MAG: integrin alpha, partial [Xanthomonadales bacterium]|nr:integrin alpha [Xanthomonadales bacterium]